MRSLKCCVSPHEECRWVQLRRYVAQLRGPRAARRGCLVSRLQLSARLYRQHVPGEHCAVSSTTHGIECVVHGIRCARPERCDPC